MQGMEVSHFGWPMAAVAAGAAAWFVSALLVLTKSLHGKYSMQPSSNIQNAHIEPTPRIGGVAIFFSVFLGMMLSTGESRQLLLGVVLAGTTAFAFGLLEDCTHRVSVASRLFATLGSGLLGWMVTGIAITDVNVPGIDTLLQWLPLAILFTAFAVGGLANAFNIIDGFNGLASGTALIALAAMGALSLQLGDVPLNQVCFVVAAAVLGFLLVNWPFGKLFLGDGGAYFVGFSIGWVAVLLLQRHAEVSAWCPLLVCAYPVLEVLFSVLRRKQRRILIGSPDRLHLHSLVKRRLVRQYFPAAHYTLRNSITGALLWIMTLLPALWALWFYDNTAMLALGLAIFAIAYQVTYVRLVRFGWHLRSQQQQSPTLSSVK
jgi:UDP-N-acetylmuramyl pentapeptide phosphotransferase/UDP-N-acetylglucosamine-1-phosphate transferase